MSAKTIAKKEPKLFGLTMLHQVLIAIVLGALIGWLFGDSVHWLVHFGVIFLKLIKMVIAPLIFFSLIAGITSLTSAHHFKGIATKAVIAYIITAMFSVFMGLSFGSIFQPGKGVPIPTLSQDKSLQDTIPAMDSFFSQVIPGNIVHAMANDLYIQIVIFAIFTGIVMNNIRGNTQMVKDLNQEMAHIVFKMIEWIVRLAPLAVFGFIASMVGTIGFEVFEDLGELMLLVILACAVQYGMLGLGIKVFAKLSPFPFYKKIFRAQMIAFSTSSSKATLTTAMRDLQDKMGVSQSTSNFVMPLGASINMDGTAIYLGIISVFFAQIYGVHLGLQEYGVLLISCTLGSIGAAGIPSGSIIFMGMVLTSVGIPMDGIVMLLAIDRILDMFRTTINITGDSTVTLIVDAMEGQLDKKKYIA